MSGFMNYKAKQLLKDYMSGLFQKPAGDVVISNFPRIYDSPDIIEELVKIWAEDIQKPIERNN
jgi:hypothetical protein